MAKAKVSFRAIKKVSKPVNVSFKTKTGEHVSFKAVRKVPKAVKVTFYAKKKK